MLCITVGEDTVDLGVVEERAGLRDLYDIHYVGLAGSVVSQYQVTPRLYLLVPRVTVGLYGVERRELILPGPLEPSRNTRRHCMTISNTATRAFTTTAQLAIILSSYEASELAKF